MKKVKFLFRLFSLFFISLAFISCGNLIENNVSEKETEVENAAAESSAGQEFILSGSMVFSGAMPEIIASKLNESESENQNARSAIPTIDSSLVEYFAYAENNYLPSSQFYKKVEGTCGTGSASRTFTIPLTLGLSWNISCGIRLKSDPQKELLKASTGSQLYSVSSVINPVVLYPQVLTNGEGKLDLTLTVPPSITGVEVVCISSNKTDWDSSTVGLTFTQGDTDTPTNGSAILKTGGNPGDTLNSGVYKIRIYCKKGSAIVYDTTQSIHIFHGLTTTLWHDSSGAAESARVIKDNGHFVLSDANIAQYSSTNFYVGSATGEGISDSNSGSHREPLETIAEALNRIKANGSASKDYTIHITGEIYASYTIGSDFDTKANSITIKGENNTSDILNGSGTARIFSISTSATIKLSDLTITDGKANGSGVAAQGGAIYKDGTSKLTIDDCIIQTNQASSGGGAIYLSSGSLEMSDTVLSSNIASGSGGALYIDSSTNITKCQITNCQFFSNNAKEGGAIQSNAKKSSNASAENCIFTGNNATGTGIDNGGGAIKVTSGMYFTVNGGTFSSNTAATDKGGAIYNNGTLYLKDTVSTALSIPAGSDNKNDIFLASVSGTEKTLSLISTLRQSEHIALITPDTHQYNRVILSEGESGGSIVGTQWYKFDLRTDSYGNVWNINDQGKLKAAQVQLKTGGEINTIFGNLGAKNYATSFEESTTPPSDTDTIEYLDSNNSAVQVWYDSASTKLKYYITISDYASNGGKLKLNEDSGNFFFHCEALESIDTSLFDTSAVTSMLQMFGYCKALTSIDVSTFNTSNVTNFKAMFRDCKVLNTLDVSNFDTHNAETLMQMFLGCEKIKTLDLSNFVTSKVEDMTTMFLNCYELETLNVSSFDTREVTDMTNTFYGCKKLASLDLSSFKTPKLKKILGLVGGCVLLTELDLSSFDFSHVTDAERAFMSCSKLETIYISPVTNFNAVTSSTNMFSGCTLLKGDMGTNFSSSNVDATYARLDGGSSNRGYFSRIKIGNKGPSEAKAVGDIVFYDATAMSYSDFMALDADVREEKKAAAIAVIFYKGTDCNDSGVSTTRTLGVGLAQKSNTSWAVDGSAPYTMEINSIKCTASGSAGNYTFSGDKNGSDNLKQIAETLADANDTGLDVPGYNSTKTPEAAAALYPSFYFAINYKDTDASHVKNTMYENGWYLPSVAELYQVYMAKTASGSVLNDALTACDGTAIKEIIYWSSSTTGGSSPTARRIQFATCEEYGNHFVNGNTIMCIREF